MPGVTLGSDLGEPRPIDCEMRRHKRDEDIRNPCVESAPLILALPIFARHDCPGSAGKP